MESKERSCDICGEYDDIKNFKICQYDFIFCCKKCDGDLIKIKNRDGIRGYVYEDSFPYLQKEEKLQGWVKDE